MEIVDAHHHLWDPRVLRYPLLETIPELNRPYGVSDFQRVAAVHRVRASVCVEAASAGADGLGEAHWLREQANASPLVKALVLWAPVEDPGLAAYLDTVQEWDDQRVVGFRRSFEFESSDFPARPEVVAGVNLIGRRGFTFDLVLFARSIRSAAELVERCPEVTFVLDHLGKPAVGDAGVESWRKDIRRIARLPNALCKLSGLVTEAPSRWDADMLKSYVVHAVECFGWDRVLYGSDWPLCERAGGYGRWLEALSDCLDGARAADLRKLFGDNASRTYRIAS